MKLSNRFTFANTAATAALVLAVAGGGTAAFAAGLAKNSVGSPQIKNGQVKTADLGKNAVTTAKIKNGTVSLADVNGAAKTAFTAGADAYYDELTFHNISSGNDDVTIFEFTVPKGDYLVSASATVVNTGGDTNDFACVVQHPVGTEFDHTVGRSEVRLEAGGVGAISVDGVAFASGPLELTMTCEGEVGDWAGKLEEPRIVAVEMGSLTEK